MVSRSRACREATYPLTRLSNLAGVGSGALPRQDANNNIKQIPNQNINHVFLSAIFLIPTPAFSANYDSLK
jgi:hypothetical protein